MDSFEKIREICSYYDVDLQGDPAEYVPICCLKGGRCVETKCPLLEENKVKGGSNESR